MSQKGFISAALAIVVVILLGVVGYFVLSETYTRDVNTTAQTKTGKSGSVSPRTTASELEVLADLKANWQAIQLSILFRPAYHNQAEDAKKIWRAPTAVQFIGNSNILVRFEDDNNPHVAVFNYNGSKPTLLETFKNTADFSASDWKNLTRTYGDSTRPVTTYTTGVIRNKEIVSFSNLTKVPENVFVKGY